ncbi:spondin-2 [Cryptotermes secundus]|uniref:spondin-2 n=1 Tax=Cryptotermes secundus TaxID=105785 RepID=UPI000CD7D110|nr:spondin-2 [Cryptotermes secundus]
MASGKLMLLCAVVLGCSVISMGAPYPEAGGEPCQPDKLTVYKVVLQTFWTRDQFPKHYPDWRPPAQWSKLVGRSHNKSFVLFRLGTRASNGVKTFAETGRTDVLEEQTQGEGGVYDEFNAPPIGIGAGRTEAEFFVDGNHSRVSLMSRIVPSPDWFIGIDSFDLCVNGNWLDSITIEVDPVDAGTDNGFTFTAPNWPTEPQGLIYRVTSHYPAHPASSFYYPYMKRLPPIATFQFIKVKEYELSEVFHHTEDERQYEVLRMEHMTRNTIDVLNNNDIEAEIEEERSEEERRIQHLSTTTHAPTISTTVTSTLEDSTSTNHMPLARVQVPSAGIIPKGDKDAILNSIVETYRSSPTSSKDHHRKKYKGKPRSKLHKIRPPRDCRVSDWSPWGPCSKSCGIGEMTRRREVLKHARRGGKVCPPLLETKWCGSARACSRGYFNW